HDLAVGAAVPELAAVVVGAHAAAPRAAGPYVGLKVRHRETFRAEPLPSLRDVDEGCEYDFARRIERACDAQDRLLERDGPGGASVHRTFSFVLFVLVASASRCWSRRSKLASQ